MKKMIFFMVVVTALAVFCDNSLALTVGPARLEVRLPAGEVAVADYYAQNET